MPSSISAADAKMERICSHAGIPNDNRIRVSNGIYQEYRGMCCECVCDRGV